MHTWLTKRDDRVGEQGKAEHEEEEEEDGASNEGTMCWQVDKYTWNSILTYKVYFCSFFIQGREEAEFT